MAKGAVAISSLDQDALEQALRAVEPAAVLVPIWLLRRIIVVDRGLGGRSAWAGHAEVHAISADRLLELVERENLPFSPVHPLQSTVILLARPEAQWLQTTSAGEALRWFWRLLFHGRVHAELDSVLPKRDHASIEERIEHIGRSAFNDARFVLQKERLVLATADQRESYIEFVAAFLEIYCFSRAQLRHVFPAMEDPEHVRDAIEDDIDPVDLLDRTRPEGASEPSPLFERNRRERRNIEAQTDQPTRRGLRYRKALMRRAERVSELGNTVRGAILRITASRLARDEQGPIHAHAMRDLEVLVHRLKSALGFDDATAAQWRSALTPVLANAARGWWNPEGRLLYDLQKVCIDHERAIYHVGVVEWLISFGRRPLRRALPAQQVVLVYKHLHSAADRLMRVSLSDQERGELEHLLRGAAHRAERQLREALGPKIEASVSKAGLRPRNAAERIAFGKLVEELLDNIIRRGYLTMGDVRDAISRGQMKFEDLSGVMEFLGGDLLLRIDRELAAALDGVYHRGEFYLRFFQRLSSLLFATAPGRFLTRYVILPFGGSYLTIAFLYHTVGKLIAKFSGVTVEVDHKSAEFITEFLSVGFFLFGVLNWRAFRATVARFGKSFGHALWWTFVHVPRWLASRPLIRAIVDSHATRLIMRYLVKPAVLAAIVWAIFARHATSRAQWMTLGIAFFAANLLNSKLGRVLEHTTLHSLGVIWSRITGEILAGLFRWVVHAFEALLESIDRTLYAVDELLRFRTGQRRLALVSKALMGTVWFFITYVTRFIINLLIEPQLNPIKHFPVVTVSHKIVAPTQQAWARGLERAGMGGVGANSMALLIVTGIPGIFGFLAWELKSNWMQYRANRFRSLRAVQIGSHGESMARFLRPGIHSGTVPKIFAKLRRAERRIGSRRARAAARKQAFALEHVAESIAHFIERELVDLVNQHPAWRATPLSVGPIKLATTRISIELFCPAFGSEGAILSFEQRSGWIMAGIDRPGWIGNLGEAQAQLLSVALIGLYKMCGVDIVREQVESMFAPYPVRCEIRRDELLVWPAGRFDVQVMYNLLDESPSPRLELEDTEIDLPTLDRRRIMLRYIPVNWEDWVAVWEALPSGEVAHVADQVRLWHAPGRQQALPSAEAAQARILADVCALPGDVLRRLTPVGEQEAWGQ